MKQIFALLFVTPYLFTTVSLAQPKDAPHQNAATTELASGASIHFQIHRRLTRQERDSLHAYVKAKAQLRRSGSLPGTAPTSQVSVKFDQPTKQFATKTIYSVYENSQNKETRIGASIEGASADNSKVYAVPFAAKGNIIQLSVANASPGTVTHVTVEATGVPAWINVIPSSVEFDKIGAKEELTATFSFSIDKLVPVNKEQSLVFVVKASNGQHWAKEIKIDVTPPEKFELYQNYPNPFNPTTTICYQLTNDSKVNLKIYNVIGQEVATLVDEQKQAGYHQEVFDATRYASGMYIYRIVYTNREGKQLSDRKTMIVVK
jgi:hypothetical protein